MLLFASFILHTSKNLTQLELTSPKKRGQCRTLHCQKGWIFSIGSTSCGVDPVFVATLKLDPYILSFNIAQKTKAWIKGKLADQISIHQNPKNDFMRAPFLWQANPNLSAPTKKKKQAGRKTFNGQNRGSPNTAPALIWLRSPLFRYFPSRRKTQLLICRPLADTA